MKEERGSEGGGGVQGRGEVREEGVGGEREGKRGRGGGGGGIN